MIGCCSTLWSAVTSAARHRFGIEREANPKAPSPLRSAGALHRVGKSQAYQIATALCSVLAVSGRHRLMLSRSHIVSAFGVIRVGYFSFQQATQAESALMPVASIMPSSER